MTLQQLLYFRTIAEKGSYVLASQELFVTQPSLSYAIQSLERELDVPLLVREKGKEIKLTSYGQALLPYTEKAMKLLDIGLSEIKTMKNPSSGVVSIALSYTASFSKTLQMLRAYQESESQHGVSLHVQVIHSGRKFLETLPAGEIDLAFSALNMGENLESLPVFDEDVVVLMPKDHPLSRCSRIGIHQIASEPLICYSQSYVFFRWLEDLFASQNIEPQIQSIVPDWVTVVANVALGSGIAITPKVPIDTDTLTAVPFVNPSERAWRTYMLWPKNRKLSPAAQEVKKFCTEYANQRNKK